MVTRRSGLCSASHGGLSSKPEVHVHLKTREESDMILEITTLLSVFLLLGVVLAIDRL